MNIEYEATFTGIDKDEVRARFTKAGAKLLRPEFLQKRVVFHLPEGHEIKGGWVRVRDEGDRITMSIKIVDGSAIEDQKESMLVVDNLEEATRFLLLLGCREKAFQESRRELWELGGAEVTIDTWPFLDPFVEVEGQGEEVVKEVSQKLGFDWSKAKFCAVGTLYREKYGIQEEVINHQTPKILFGMENPFLKI